MICGQGTGLDEGRRSRYIDWQYTGAGLSGRMVVFKRNVNGETLYGRDAASNIPSRLAALHGRRVLMVYAAAASAKYVGDMRRGLERACSG